MAIKRVQSMFLVAEQAQHSLFLRMQAHENLLASIQIEKAALLKKQKDAIQACLKENEQTSLLNGKLQLLSIDLNELVQVKQVLLDKKNSLLASFNYLESVKQALSVEDLFFDVDDAYIGDDWYIPYELTSFDKLIVAMNWGVKESQKWLATYDESQKFHKNNKEGVFTFVLGAYQYYVSDLYKKNSPRKSLLEAIQAHQKSFYLNQLKIENNELNNLNEAIERTKEIIEMGNEERNAHELNTQKMQKVLAGIELELALHKTAYEQWLVKKKSILSEYDFSKECLMTRFILPLYLEWGDLLKLMPTLFEKSFIRKNYQLIVAYQEKLKAFSLKIKIHCEENHFDFEKISLNFHLLSYKADCKLFFQLSHLVNELNASCNTLMLKYDALHQDWFMRLKAQTAAHQAKQDAKKLATKQVLEERKVNLRNYLGDKDTPGDLNNYLAQRNATFWWRDYFSFYLALMFKYPFGYITEKEKRTLFINKKLRPTLEAYQANGDNRALATLLCSPNAMFFKPRTREGHSYCLTLDCLLDNMRKELLTKEQIASYYEKEELQQTGDYLKGYL